MPFAQEKTHNSHFAHALYTIPRILVSRLIKENNLGIRKSEASDGFCQQFKSNLISLIKVTVELVSDPMHP